MATSAPDGGNIQIAVTENGTTTLATAGKYCDRNIDVNVNVKEKPTQFTNYYKPEYVTIDYKVVVSSGVVNKEANSEANIVRIPYHHKVGEPFEMRMRGIGTVRSNFVLVFYKADGETKENHYYFNTDSYFTTKFDEYGDMVITGLSGILNREWYFMEFNFQYVFMSSATEARTGPIITINEPIGNGGYAG
jgi:hypothetical protein